jgi:glucose/arabinose dehydrogenase
MLLLLLLAARFATAQPRIDLNLLVGGLSAPVDIAATNDNRLFIAEQGGTVRIVRNGALLPAPFLNIGPVLTSGGERGLLSLAFHPQYKTNGYFFVYYTRSGDGAITVARYRVSDADSNTADPLSGVVLMTIPKRFSNHNGGDLNFGPDGHLYFATGDGGSGNDPDNNAQNGASLLGKMIRINVDNFTTPPYYTIPADNPFVSDPAVRDEIWALGLRNPFRWSFDRSTGDMWIGDVGQNAREEINYRPADSAGGANFGWRCFEGSIPTPGIPTPCAVLPWHTRPVYDYINPAGSGTSVIGGYVYRGNRYPSLRGYYLAADVYLAHFYLLQSNGSGGFTTTVQTGLPGFMVGFGEDRDGELYAVSQGSNALYRVAVADEGPLPVRLTSFSASRESGFHLLRWTTATESGTDHFNVEWSRDGRSFSKAGEVAAARQGGSTYEYRHPAASGSSVYYRLAMVDDDGSVRYSPVLRLAEEGAKPAFVSPNVIDNRVLNLYLRQPGGRLQLVDAQGRVAFAQDLGGLRGAAVIHLPVLARGIYIVQVSTGQEVHREKIIVR